jgi:hypothetical protein
MAMTCMWLFRSGREMAMRTRDQKCTRGVLGEGRSNRKMGDGEPESGCTHHTKGFPKSNSGSRASYKLSHAPSVGARETKRRRK